jgi:hypothetical protein
MLRKKLKDATNGFKKTLKEKKIDIKNEQGKQMK